VHEALRQLVSSANVYRFAEIASEPAKRSAKPEAVMAAGDPIDAAKTVLPKPTTESTDATIAANLAEKNPTENKTTKERAADSDAVDSRLHAFLEASHLCSDRIMEKMPGDIRAAIPVTNASTEILRPTNECESFAIAAVRLPHLERNFSTVWPPAVRYMLPSHGPGVPIEQTWAPVLSWIVLQGLPTPGIRASLFDTLQLRSVLAEIFSSMGVEDERTWRMAAQVRVLLMQSDNPSLAFDTDEFWQDSDVRWLAGVNEAAGVTYINKEHFEELICWIQLPALLTITQHESSGLRSLREVEVHVGNACAAARKAGYKLKDCVSLMREVTGAHSPSRLVERPRSSPEKDKQKS
jgi:hypothetical protein